MSKQRENQPFSSDRSHRPARPISGIVDEVISSLGLTKSYNGWLVVSNWREIVGGQIAKKAPAIRFTDGVIYVAVQDSAWRQTLHLQLEDILKTIRSHPCGRGVQKVILVSGERGKLSDDN